RHDRGPELADAPRPRVFGEELVRQHPRPVRNPLQPPLPRLPPDVARRSLRKTRRISSPDFHPRAGAEVRGTTGREGRTERRRLRQQPRDATCGGSAAPNPLPYHPSLPAPPLAVP